MFNVRIEGMQIDSCPPMVHLAAHWAMCVAFSVADLRTGVSSVAAPHGIFCWLNHAITGACRSICSTRRRHHVLPCCS